MWDCQSRFKRASFIAQSQEFRSITWLNAHSLPVMLALRILRLALRILEGDCKQYESLETHCKTTQEGLWLIRQTFQMFQLVDYVSLTIVINLKTPVKKVSDPCVGISWVRGWSSQQSCMQNSLSLYFWKPRRDDVLAAEVISQQPSWPRLGPWTSDPIPARREKVWYSRWYLWETLGSGHRAIGSLVFSTAYYVQTQDL